jgi:hypothetical protein
MAPSHPSRVDPSSHDCSSGPPTHEAGKSAVIDANGVAKIQTAGTNQGSITSRSA